jgi:hypothetical protein
MITLSKNFAALATVPATAVLDVPAGSRSRVHRPGSSSRHCPHRDQCSALRDDETTVPPRRYGGMNPEIAKLMTDLERYRNLRRSINDRKAQQELDQLIKETEERLWHIENATTD